MAHEFYFTITGKKQGKFPGEVATKPHDGKILGLAFELDLIVPHDPPTGHLSGKRTYKPIKVTKPWGQSSPLLLKAVVENELLTTIVFDFPKVGKAGGEEPYEQIELTNAQLVGYRQFKVADSTTASSGPGGGTHSRELEEIWIVFQQITLTNMPSKKVASDYWKVT